MKKMTKEMWVFFVNQIKGLIGKKIDISSLAGKSIIEGNLDANREKNSVSIVAKPITINEDGSVTKSKDWIEIFPSRMVNSTSAGFMDSATWDKANGIPSNFKWNNNAELPTRLSTRITNLETMQVTLGNELDNKANSYDVTKEATLMPYTVSGFPVYKQIVQSTNIDGFDDFVHNEANKIPTNAVILNLTVFNESGGDKPRKFVSNYNSSNYSDYYFNEEGQFIINTSQYEKSFAVVEYFTPTNKE